MVNVLPPVIVGYPVLCLCACFLPAVWVSYLDVGLRSGLASLVLSSRRPFPGRLFYLLCPLARYRPLVWCALAKGALFWSVGEFFYRPTPHPVVWFILCSSPSLANIACGLYSWFAQHIMIISECMLS